MKLHVIVILSLFIFISDEVLRKVHDTIKFKGNNYNCDHFHTTNSFGTWCGCPFLACTGGQDCYGTYHCFIKNKNYDFRDMKDEDCDCDHHRKWCITCNWLTKNEVNTACEKHGSLSLLVEIVTSVKGHTVISFSIRKIKKKGKEKKFLGEMLSYMATKRLPKTSILGPDLAGVTVITRVSMGLTISRQTGQKFGRWAWKSKSFNLWPSSMRDKYDTNTYSQLLNTDSESPLTLKWKNRPNQIFMIKIQ